jgi:hypothetical protein
MKSKESNNGQVYQEPQRFTTPAIPPPLDEMEPTRPTKQGVDFDDNIPKVGPELFILRMKADRRLTFQLWGTRIRGIWTHWSGPKSIPHFRDESICPGCLQGKPTRWKGYLHCYCVEMRQEVFLELTPASARSLRDQIHDPANMRGGVIQVKRGTGDNGRLYISILSHVPNVEALPKEKDPRPSILKLWGISEEKSAGWLADEAGRGDEANFV